jgi:hypothetical protein
MNAIRKLVWVWSKVLSFLLRLMVRLGIRGAVFEFICLLLFVRPTARLYGRLFLGHEY